MGYQPILPQLKFLFRQEKPPNGRDNAWSVLTSQKETVTSSFTKRGVQDTHTNSMYWCKMVRADCSVRQCARKG